MTQTQLLRAFTPNTALALAALLAGLAAACTHVDDGGGDTAVQELASSSAGTDLPVAEAAAPSAGGPRHRGPACDGDGPRGPRGMGGPGCDGEGPHGPGAAGRHGPRDPAAFFARWDPDGDGQVALKDLPEPAQARLSEADANGDGNLTRAELDTFHAERRAERLAELDTDHDGTVSDAERDAFRQQRHEARFKAADRNGDGALTADEVDPRRWERMSVADTDGDARITRAELDAAFAAGKLGPPQDGARRGRRGNGHGPRGERGPQSTGSPR